MKSLPTCCMILYRFYCSFINPTDRLKQDDISNGQNTGESHDMKNMTTTVHVLTHQMKGRCESNIYVWYPFMYSIK